MQNPARPNLFPGRLRQLIPAALISLGVQVPVTGQINKSLNRDSLLLDFRILHTSVCENHPFYGFYTSPDSLERLAALTEQQILKGNSLLDFHLSLSGYVGAIGCGHTYVYNSNSTRKHLPFDISVEDNSIYFSKSRSPVLEKFSGHRIIAINHLTAGEFVRHAYSTMSSDGFNTAYKKQRLERDFAFSLSTSFKDPDSLCFTLDNGTFTIPFNSAIQPTPVMERSASFRPHDSVKNTVVLVMPDFDEGRMVIRKCFRYLDKTNTGNLVIDLRDNGGGNGNIASLLLSYLVDSTFGYSMDKKSNPLRYRNNFEGAQGLIISNQCTLKDSLTKSYRFSVKPRKKHHFGGQLYVLVNGGSFSSAAFAASVLAQKSKAVFIGEETGGSAYAIGGGVIRRLRLPYSGLSVKFPFYKWIFHEDPRSGGHGVIPFYKVAATPPYLSDGADLALQKAVELFLQQQAEK